MESSSLKRVTTLEGMLDKITYKRRDGNTTRLVDNAIQILFNGDICVVLDHHEMGRNSKANKHLFDAILKRLEVEHRWFFEQKRVKIDKNRLEIRLVEEPMLDKLELGTGVTLNNI
jgi:hypothetical protein